MSDHGSLRPVRAASRLCGSAYSLSEAESRHYQSGSTQHGEIAWPPHPRGEGHGAWHNLCTLSTAVTHQMVVGEVNDEKDLP